MPPPPPPPRPLLSKARGEPRFSPPSGRAEERSRLARHMAVRAARPDWLVLASSSQAHAARGPRPEGRAQQLRLGRRGTAPESAARPCAHRVSALRFPRTGPPHPPQPPGLFAHAQNAYSCPTGVSRVSVRFRAPVGSEEASRGPGNLRNHPCTDRKQQKEK